MMICLHGGDGVHVLAGMAVQHLVASSASVRGMELLSVGMFEME